MSMLHANERYRTLTKGLRLGLGRNLEWEKDFGKKIRSGSREKRERSRYLILSKTGSDLKYIYIYIKRSSINREGIEHLSRTKSRKINRYRGGIDGKMILIDRGGIKHLSSKKKTPKNWLNGSGYLLRGIENKPKGLHRRGMYRRVIKQLLRRY